MNINKPHSLIFYKKMCQSCFEPKDRSEFRKRAAAKDGLQGYCRPCANLCNEAFRAAGKRASRACMKVLNPRPNKP